jgi:hypothetical protein
MNTTNQPFAVAFGITSALLDFPLALVVGFNLTD